MVSMARWGHRPLLRPAAALLLALLASLWFGMDWGGVHLTLVADDLLQFAVPGVAAVSCAVAATRSRDQRRLTWGLVAASCGCAAAGDLIWFVIEVVMGHPVPFPSLADVGYLTAIPFAFAAVLSWRGPWAKLRSLSVLQGLVLAGSLLMVSWAFVLRPLIASSGLDPLGDVLDIVYPVTDVLLLSLIAFALVYRMRPVPYGLVLLGLGFVAITVADSTFTYMTLRGTFGVTNWIDAGWLLGYAWIGCAPLSAADEAGAVPEPARSGILLLVLPYIGLAGAITAAVYELVSGFPVDPVLTALAFVVVLLLLTLQLVALLENRTWARAVKKLNQEKAAVLDLAGEGICVVDMEGRCRLVNRAASEMLGRTEAELLGADWLATVHHTLPSEAPYPEESCPIHSSLTEGTRQQGRDEFWRADGTPLEVEYSVVPLIEEQRATGALVIFQDVSERTNREARLTAYAAQESGLAGIARRGLTTDPPDVILTSATSVAARTLDADLAAVYRYEGDRMVRMTSFGSPSLPREWRVSDLPLTERLLTATVPLAVPDYARSDVTLSEPLRERGIRSSVMVAIRGSESPYGALFLHSFVPRSHSESDLKWLQSIADVVSVVIERARANEELQATVIELTRVDDQRRSLLEHLVKAQEEERHRIAADLHDDVVQLMTAINLRLEVVRKRDGSAGDGNVDALQQLVAQSVRRLRELLFELHPPTLDEYGLAAALRVQLDQFTASTGITAQLRTDITQEPEANARTVLYRIAQEALQNVRKHAEARSVALELTTVSGGTQVLLRDDGRGLPSGFSSQSPSGHLGLTAMEERARLAGGWWRISGADEGGTAVEFWVPGLLPPPPATALDPERPVRPPEPQGAETLI